MKNFFDCEMHKRFCPSLFKGDVPPRWGGGLNDDLTT